MVISMHHSGYYNLVFGPTIPTSFNIFTLVSLVFLGYLPMSISASLWIALPYLLVVSIVIILGVHVCIVCCVSLFRCLVALSFYILITCNLFLFTCVSSPTFLYRFVMQARS